MKFEDKIETDNFYNPLPQNFIPTYTQQDVSVLLFVKKRDGTVRHFDIKKVTIALHKAFVATYKYSTPDVLQQISTSIEQQIIESYEGIDSKKNPIDIESIQDIVESKLMELGYYKVSKSYILYRAKRSELRKLTKHSRMRVVKKNGTQEPVSFEEITSHIEKLSHHLNIDILYIAQKIIAGLYDQITTTEISKFLAETIASFITEHPDYSKLATAIIIENLHKNTEGFLCATEKLASLSLLNPTYLETIRHHGHAIESIIDYSRDYDYDYFGISTLLKSYLLKYNTKVVERPSDMWMRVAITVTNTTKTTFNKERLKETYDLLSKKYYTHATPTLFNAGLNLQQLSSCFLLAMEDDSIEGIFNTLKDTALISKLAGGVGIHVSNIRSHGSKIKRTNGISNGLIPFLKIFNETARSVDQGGGKRKGSFAIYIEPWHADIEGFLDLRKNFGAEEFRARELFYALWIPDLFMERVEKGEDWTLMSPSECPGLSDCYGEEFRALYTKYEKENKGRETIKARDLMTKIVESQIEQGQPYMLYKDSVNKKSNQKNIGVIKSSNLCAEIVEYSDSKETAVCNLASISLPKFVKGLEFDFQSLKEVAYITTKNLNTLIDINYYPTEKTKTSNFKHRPISLGIQGLADVFFKLQLPYDSKKSIQLNKQIFETIYYGALQASCDLAKEFGPYETFEGSPLSLGQLQFDLWGVAPTLWNFDTLKKDIIKYGVRNSLLTSCMPTASTSVILGNTESFQIQSNNIYKRQTLSGEFLLINKYLVKELEKINIWNQDIRDRIVLNNGSIQNIASIPKYLRNIYKTTWEISQKTALSMSADRSPFIDQSQSLNLWLASPTVGQVNAMHFYAWKLGLKTGMYYLRSQPSVMPVKVTVNQHNQQPISSSFNVDEECIECSA